MNNRFVKGGYLLWVVANMTMALYNAESFIGDGWTTGHIFPFSETMKDSKNIYFIFCGPPPVGGTVA